MRMEMKIGIRDPFIYALLPCLNGHNCISLSLPLIIIISIISGSVIVIIIILIIDTVAIIALTLDISY